MRNHPDHIVPGVTDSDVSIVDCNACTSRDAINRVSTSTLRCSPGCLDFPVTE